MSRQCNTQQAACARRAARWGKGYIPFPWGRRAEQRSGLRSHAPCAALACALCCARMRPVLRSLACALCCARMRPVLRSHAPCAALACALASCAGGNASPGQQRPRRPTQSADQLKLPSGLSSSTSRPGSAAESLGRGHRRFASMSGSAFGSSEVRLLAPRRYVYWLLGGAPIGSSEGNVPSLGKSSAALWGR
eukprot:358772-Chlamydomonas_euryale.AAC.1